MHAWYGMCVHRIADMAAEELAANAENVYKNAVYHNDPAPTAPTNTNHTTRLQRLAMQVLWTEYLTAEAADRLRAYPDSPPTMTHLLRKNSKLCNSAARARVFSATAPRAHAFSLQQCRARTPFSLQQRRAHTRFLCNSAARALRFLCNSAERARVFSATAPRAYAFSLQHPCAVFYSNLALSSTAPMRCPLQHRCAEHPCAVLYNTLALACSFSRSRTRGSRRHAAHIKQEM
jgi:hypothetical protein